MPARTLLIPVVLLAVTAGAIAFNAARSSGASPDGEATPQATATAVPEFPDGVSGTLHYRTQGDMVSFDFGTGQETAREPVTPIPSLEVGAGYASIAPECGDAACTLTLTYADGRADAYHYGSFGWQEWNNAGDAVAMAVTRTDGREEIIVMDGGAPRTMFHTAGEHVDAFSWHGDGLLVAIADSRGTRLATVSAEGIAEDVAWAAARVNYLYASPDESNYVFTQAAADGWKLWRFDVSSGEVSSLGNMGSDPAGTAPPKDVAPEDGKNGPMYIAWSPDASSVAFGGGWDPPYFMTIVNIATGVRVTTQFTAGYPGEIHWSPDGSLVAVSTYDLERRHHETWVVDPATGAGTHLMDGCVIVWSPDSGFLAVHGEDRPGISIVDVRSGARGQLTHVIDDTPLAWEN